MDIVDLVYRKKSITHRHITIGISGLLGLLLPRFGNSALMSMDSASLIFAYCPAPTVANELQLLCYPMTYALLPKLPLLTNTRIAQPSLHGLELGVDIVPPRALYLAEGEQLNEAYTHLGK